VIASYKATHGSSPSKFWQRYATILTYPIMMNDKWMDSTVLAWSLANMRSGINSADLIE
jgi:hypothetical protein